MNITHYPTPSASWTTFIALDRTCIKNHGTCTKPPELIYEPLSFQVAVVEFLDELWMETSGIVAVHNGATVEEVTQAMLKLVMRPEYRQAPTFKHHQRCVPDCDTKTKAQFNEFMHEVSATSHSHHSHTHTTHSHHSQPPLTTTTHSHHSQPPLAGVEHQSTRGVSHLEAQPGWASSHPGLGLQQ